MLRAIWDWLFVRRQWTIIKEIQVYSEEDPNGRPVADLYVLQDQFGNIKRKKVRA